MQLAKPGITQKVDAALRQAAYSAEAVAKRSLAEPKTGTLYKRGNIIHQASAPGEPPAMDTGLLANSISTTAEGSLRYVVSASAHYAIYLEYGTYKMAARPFMRPAFEQVKPGFLEAIARALR